MRYLLAPAVRKVQIVGMKVHDIEIFCSAENFLNHQNMMGERINALRIQVNRLKALVAPRPVSAD